MCFYGVWLKCWLIFTWSWTYLISWEYWISLWFVDNTCMIWQFFFFDVQVLLSFMSQQLCCNICWKNEKAIGLLRPWERCFLLRAALQSQCYQEKNYKCAYVISLQMKEQKLVLCTCSLAISDKRRNRSKT